MSFFTEVYSEIVHVDHFFAEYYFKQAIEIYENYRNTIHSLELATAYERFAIFYFRRDKRALASQCLQQ